MKAHGRYLENIEMIIRHIRETQDENIEKVAQLMAATFENCGLVYLFGTGHSHLLAEELFFRAGGPVAVCPILIPSLMLHKEASKSTVLERRKGYIGRFLANYDLRPGDLFVAISNSGRNAAVVEAAQVALDRGLRLVALTSLRAAAQQSRHHGRPLSEMAEVVLDNGGIDGDAAVSLVGLTRPVAATSTVAGATLLQCVAARAIEVLLERGVAPEVYASSNIDGGDQINLQYLNKYRGKIPHL